MDVQISAIICTFNRASYLRKAIQSLVEQTLDTNCYEIIIVDNRSTDNTKQIATEEFAHVPNLRYIYESIQGLSQARNTGWQNARGEYIAYLDDDAIASSQWLEKILEVFATVTPRPGCVGGKIEPIWEISRPSWLSDKMLDYLTVIDWSDRPKFLNENQFLAGANMAFPRELLKNIKGFRVELGRKGNNLLSNEELLLRDRLLEMGYKCFYHPEIKVKHHIPQSRIHKNYFVKRLYWQGISDAILLATKKSISRLDRLKLARKLIIEFWNSPYKRSMFIKATDDPDILWQKFSKFKEIGYIIGIIGII